MHLPSSPAYIMWMRNSSIVSSKYGRCDITVAWYHVKSFWVFSKAVRDGIPVYEARVAPRYLTPIHLVISEWDWGTGIPGSAPGRVWWCGCCLCVRDSLSGAPGHCRTPYGETLSETSTTQNVDLSQQSHQSTQVYWARLISLTYWKLELVQHPVSERNWSSLIDQAHTCVHNTGTHFPLNKFNAQ